MNVHEKINYVEFPAKDIEAAKRFFTAAFGWSFTDHGPEYAAFSSEGLDGVFSNPICTPTRGTEARWLSSIARLSRRP